MPEPAHDHDRLVLYLLDELGAEERVSFEAHLDGCASCATEAESLGGVAGKLATMAPATVPPDLTAGVLAAVESVASADARLAAGGDLATVEWGREMNGTHRSLPEPGREPVVGPTAVRSEKRPRRSAWSGWPLRVGFAAAFAAMTAAIVIAVGSDGSGVTAPVEIQGTLSGDSSGEIVVSELGSGREVELTSSELPILPKGELYEIWFVGPGDAPADPNRISGGTFHPDEAGNTDVTLHAAVDPALYPLIEITAEPGSGDPAVEGDVIARLDGSDQLP